MTTTTMTKVQHRDTGSVWLVDENASLHDIENNCPLFFKTKHGKRETYSVYRGCLIVRATRQYTGTKPYRDTTVYLYGSCQSEGDGIDVICVSAGSRCTSTYYAKKLIDHMLDLLENKHGKELVRSALMFLASARYALTQAELLQLLLSDEGERVGLEGEVDVEAEMFAGVPTSRDWWRFIRDLQPFLRPRGVHDMRAQDLRLRHQVSPPSCMCYQAEAFACSAHASRACTERDLLQMLVHREWLVARHYSIGPTVA